MKNNFYNISILYWNGDYPKKEKYSVQSLFQLQFYFCFRVYYEIKNYELLSIEMCVLHSNRVKVHFVNALCISISFHKIFYRIFASQNIVATSFLVCLKSEFYEGRINFWNFIYVGGRGKFFNVQSMKNSSF